MTEISFYLKTTVPYDEESIEAILKTCSDEILEITKIQDVVFSLNFALQELIINSLEHGYKKSSGNISIGIYSVKDEIHLEVSDEGLGMDSAVLDDNLEITSLEDIKIRGWGLNILKKIFTGMSITKNNPQGTKVSLILSV
jgi:serine/threonine-protein kinase RsbW